MEGIAGRGESGPFNVSKGMVDMIARVVDWTVKTAPTATNGC